MKRISDRITYDEILEKDLPSQAIDYILTNALTKRELQVFAFYNNKIDKTLKQYAEEKGVSRQNFHQIMKRLYVARLISDKHLDKKSKSGNFADNREKWRKRDKDIANGLKKRVIRKYIKWKREE